MRLGVFETYFYILYLNQSAPNVMVYEKLGRYLNYVSVSIYVVKLRCLLF